MATAKLTAVVSTKGVKKSSNELGKFTKAANDSEKQTKKTGKSVGSLKAPFGAFIGFVGKAATTGLAFAAAGAAIVVASAKANRELEILSRQARTTASDFQATTFATQQYGITAEQFADISKDVADKVGEFATAGTGAFQDYADVLGLTKEEAVKTAKEFQGLSSQEVLGKVVSGLEDVNATGDQTTFVLESLGNDLSRLAPLFANNSSELNTLKDRYKDVNDQLALTGDQSAALEAVAASGTLLTDSLGNASKLISSAVAPILDDFFNDVISVVPQATQAVVDFINTFKDAENINSIKSVKAEIESITKDLAGAEKLRDEGKIKRLDFFNARVEEEKNRLAELNSRLKELESSSISSPISPTGGNIGGATGTVSTGDKTAQTKKEIDNILSLNDSALERITAKEEEQKARIRSALSQGVIDRKTALDAEIAAQVNAESQRMEIVQREEEQLKRNREAAGQRLEGLINLNNTELEEIERVKNERLEKLKSDYENRLILESDFQEAKKEIEINANKARYDELQRLDDIRKKKEEEARAQRRKVGEGVLSDLATIGGKQNELLKAQAKANAVVKAYESANSAFAALAPIPIVGPALGAAAAGVAIAAGLANVRAIDSAREQGGTLAAGQTSTVAERGVEILTPANASRVRTANDMRNIMGETQSQPNVNIVVIDQSEGSKTFDQSVDDEGRIVMMIRNTVSADIGQANSQISKSFGANTTAQRKRA